MIRHCPIEAEPAEPAISQVEGSLFPEATLRSDAQDRADQQHPDHQLRVDRGASDAAIERRQIPPDLFKVDKSIDRPEQMVGWNVPLERELIEQRRLIALPMYPHALQSCRLDRLNH